MTRAPSSLDDLPSNLVRPLAGLAVGTLRKWAEDIGHRFVLIDLGAAGDKKAALKAIGRALDFPDWYGANLDALFDCLTDLSERKDVPGWLLVIDRLPPPAALDAEQRDALLDVFRDAADAFADDGVPLRVLFAAG
jgi:RNAse (barnase) inhibitor barstar